MCFQQRRVPDSANLDSSGTFYFSSLNAFFAETPFLYDVRAGNGNLTYCYNEIGFFVADDIRLGANLSMGLGLRYDRQSSLRDHNNFSPRLSLSFAPGQSRRTVMRTGAGIFYDRTVAKAVRERLFFDGQRLRRFRVSDPGFPEPFGDPASTQVPPSSVVMFGPDLKSPYVFEYSLALEHELKKRLSASITYSGTRGVNIFRSRDVNAPLPPSYESRPNPSIGLHRQIESSGNLSGHRVKAALRGRLSSLLNGS
ncbi:MAG: TonB-dependent receptor domain-containing protein, partial [Candidatus Acidiferrales bacterium]